jgi:hypothetical protein
MIGLFKFKLLSKKKEEKSSVSFVFYFEDEEMDALSNYFDLSQGSIKKTTINCPEHYDCLSAA